LAERLDRLPWESGRFLLFVGALTAGKGLQSLVAALPALLRSHPSAHLLVVGSGAYREVLEGCVHAIDRGDAELFRHLRERGFDLDRSELSGPWDDVRSFEPRPGLRDHVHFLGRLDHVLLRHLFPCADLAVFPSVVPEAYPLVLMESLSNGVLPLVSDFSGFADGLATLEPLLGEDLVDLMRLPIGSRDRVPAIAERLARLLDHLDLERWGPRLRKIAIEQFDWPVRARQMAAAYSRLVTRSRNA
jgi:glycosyltransferase involved in cell wall biosynthesis